MMKKSEKSERKSGKIIEKLSIIHFQYLIKVEEEDRKVLYKLLLTRAKISFKMGLERKLEYKFLPKLMSKLFPFKREHFYPELQIVLKNENL